VAEAAREREAVKGWSLDDLEVLENALAGRHGVMGLATAEEVPGLPTIHTMGRLGYTRHCGFGMFETTGQTEDGVPWKLVWDAGGAMLRTPSGHPYTTVMIEGPAPIQVDLDALRRAILSARDAQQDRAAEVQHDPAREAEEDLVVDAGAGERLTDEQQAAGVDIPDGPDDYDNAPDDTNAFVAQAIDTVHGRKSRVLEDFGEKIGGARKDLYAVRGMQESEYQELNETEKAQMAIKRFLWPAVDRRKMVSEGVDPLVAFAIKTLQRGLPGTAMIHIRGEGLRRANTVDVIDAYAKAMIHVRDRLAEVRTWDEFVDAVEDLEPYFNGYHYGCLQIGANKNLIRTIHSFLFSLDREYGGEDLRRRMVSAMEREDDRARLKAQQKKHNRGDKEANSDDGEKGDNRRDVIQREIAMKMAKHAVANTDGHYIYTIVKPIAVKVRSLTRDVVYPAFFHCPRRRGVAIDAPNWETIVLAEDAPEYLVEAATDLAAKAGNGADKAALVDEEQARNLHGLQRVGPKWRDGSVTPEMFLETFGFRGGEFGHWMTGVERQAAIDAAFDGFMDLADVLGVPTSMMSLNGRLAIAFGARGRGHAAAHYEPGRAVVNLTRTKGAGCLAHEWSHAVDHWLCDTLCRDSDILEPYASRLMAKVARQLDDYNVVETKAHHPLIRSMDAILWRRITAADNDADVAKEAAIEVRRALGDRRWQWASRALDRLVPGIVQKLQDDSVDHWAVAREIREAIGSYVRFPGPLERYMMLMNCANQVYRQGKIRKTMVTNFSENAEFLDSKRKTPYWSTPWELFARAFESSVALALQRQGRRSDYLVHRSYESEFVAEGRTVSRYPQGVERDIIAKTLLAELPQAIRLACEMSQACGTIPDGPDPGKDLGPAPA
jgi:hypothetical protein